MEFTYLNHDQKPMSARIGVGMKMYRGTPEMVAYYFEEEVFNNIDPDQIVSFHVQHGIGKDCHSIGTLLYKRFERCDDSAMYPDERTNFDNFKNDNHGECFHETGDRR